MTVAVNDTIERYTIAGVGPYAYTWRIFNDTDLQVSALSTAVPPVATPLTNISDYTVVGANVSSGGSITLTAAAAALYAGYTLDIRSNTPENQPTSIRNTARFLPEIHEDAYDYLSRQIQDLNRRVNASVHLPDNEILSGEVEPATTRKGRYLFWDAVTGAISSALSITGTVLTQLIFNAYYALTDDHKRTDTEIAAGVVPINYAFLPGHVYRYGTNTVPGTTDMVAAINLAINSWNGKGGTVRFPADTLAIASQILVTARGIRFVGEGCSDLNGTGAGNRGATCILRTFAGTKVSAIIFNADDCGIDLIDCDGNLQGTLCHGLEVWGSRFNYGLTSFRNHSGRGQRFGRDDSASGGNNASRANVNFLSIRRAISRSNRAGGILFDDQNLTTSLSYPLGQANCNACDVGSIDSSNNGVQYTITNITQAASAVVTINTVSATNPIAVGDSVSFQNVLGMTQINSVTTLQACNVTAIGGVSGAWTFTIGVNSTGYTAYASGGLAGVGDGVTVWNANDIEFSLLGSQTNFGCGVRFKSDGTNVVARCHLVSRNDCEGNIGPDVQIDGGTLPATGPGGYSIIFGNRSVAVDPRIVDNSTGSLIVKWVPGLNKRAYCFGDDMNVINPAAGGAAGYNMSVGANASPVRLMGVAVGATDSLMRAAVRKVATGLTVGLEINEYAVCKPKNELFAVTYSASMTIDAATGTFFQVTANNGVAHTFNAPINLVIGETIRVQIRNTSGGALGAATFNAIFKMAAWVQPLNGFSRWAEFNYNGTNLVETFRSAADVPN